MSKEIDPKISDAGHGEIDTGKSTDIRKAATNAIHRMILQGRMLPTTPSEREMLENHRKEVEKKKKK